QPREDDTICDKCHGLHLSCILGHDVTIDDMKHFQEHSASHFDLGYIYRPSHLLCRMCSFLRDCLSIEHLQLNDNPSKPKLVRSSASEFFGVRNRKEFLNAPCLVFAPKKEDGQGCILPAASSSHRQGTIVGRKLEPDKIGYSIFSHWLSFCKERHEKICERPRGANDTRSFSLKVIDCATRKILSLPLGGKEDYVTLSYVWGLSTDTSGNKEDSTELPESVPKVIEDAMIVVMQLGLRFLWVDRYCIPQEDDKEKHSQLRNMGTIYSNSVLTIIAAAGEGPDHGLPGVSSTLRLPQPSIRWGSDELVYCLSRGGRREIQSSKWNSRGWTYQEGLLARRRLIFTERQVYFQCQAMHQNESITTQLDSVRVKNVFPLSIDFGFYFPTFQDLQRSPTSFQSRVQEFIRREFTFDSDVLAAFQGILALFETSKAPISHLCGIPLFS
ncbi:heterokaryon incompatibility protein-domain-containing protein, partial [Diplogelasinospora grovesii]